MIKVDLQDACMSVPVAPKSRCLLVFIFDGKIYHFKVVSFGLNSAPRIFTKLFKPILRLLKSQGMLLMIYLDNILPIRSGILGEHEQVRSYCHPKNNISGFCYRLCKYENFSPRGKTIGNNSEGQLNIRSKFDLYSKPVSVCTCRYVSSYMPSKH